MQEAEEKHRHKGICTPLMRVDKWRHGKIKYQSHKKNIEIIVNISKLSNDLSAGKVLPVSDLNLLIQMNAN